MWEGAEVSRAVVLSCASCDESWPWIIHADAHEQEAFVVPKRDIVARAVVLDEFAFKNQRFLFIANGVEFEVVDGIDECAGLQVGFGFPRGDEV